MKSLIIVESPAKIEKIKKILGNGYDVVSTYGHIMDLDSKTMAIDFENNFKPSYKFYPDKFKKSVIKKIKDSYEKCNMVYIASDLDREGEFIGESIKKLLNIKSDESYERIIFTSITKSAIETAINNPIKLNYNKIHAQQTRRFIDRIYGYSISPLLSQVVKYAKTDGLGCGRVQNILVKLIVDKEKEIEEYYNKTITSEYVGSGLFNINVNDKILVLDTNLKTPFSMNLPSNLGIIGGLMTIVNWYIDNIMIKQLSRNCKPPFITSTLQSEISSKYGWSIKRISELSQQLYEAGYITYIRTDSVTLSDECLNACEQIIKNEYGDKYYCRKQHETSNNTAQEAHEAIRPVDMKIKANTLDISDQLRKLYDIIWKRTLASQMSKLEIESIQIKLHPIFITEKGMKKSKNDNPIPSIFYMTGSKNRVVFKGYTVVYNEDDDNEEIGDKESNDELNNLMYLWNNRDNNKADINIDMLMYKFNEVVKNPPSRYNEAQLIKTITKLGIGRPATYVSLIEKIQTKLYVKSGNIEGQAIECNEIIYDKNKDKLTTNIIKKSLGKENNRLIPTELGMTINEFMVKNFPRLLDINFTANLESQLDLIVNGKINWLQVVKEFYDDLTNQISLFKSLNNEPKQVNKNTGTSIILKTIGKYIIREKDNNKFMQVGMGKKVKFYSLKNIVNIDELNEVKCKEIINSIDDIKKKYKKMTKNI